MEENILHPGDYSKRLPEDHGSDIIEMGKRLGESEPVKDTFWSFYKLDDEYYITLNDWPDSVWIANEETVNLYLEK